MTQLAISTVGSAPTPPLVRNANKDFSSGRGLAFLVWITANTVASTSATPVRKDTIITLLNLSARLAWTIVSNATARLLAQRAQMDTSGSLLKKSVRLARTIAGTAPMLPPAKPVHFYMC